MATMSNSNNWSSDPKERSEDQHRTGQVYFIRHGESTSNERNIFARDKISQVYDRASRFYEEKVVPHWQRGENVLDFGLFK